MGQISKDSRAQIRLAYPYVAEVLEAAGASWDGVVSVTTYHVDMRSHIDDVLEIHRDFERRSRIRPGLLSVSPNSMSPRPSSKLVQSLGCNADRIGPAHLRELVIDCEEDRTLRAVLIWVLRKADLGALGIPGAPPHGEPAV